MAASLWIGVLVIWPTAIYMGAHTFPTLLAGRRIRRAGHEVSAAVVDLSARQRPWGAGQIMTPVVRYSLDGHSHDAPLLNWDNPARVGDGMTVIVSAQRRYDPWLAIGGDQAWRLRQTLFVVAVELGISAAAVAAS